MSSRSSPAAPNQSKSLSIFDGKNSVCQLSLQCLTKKIIVKAIDNVDVATKIITSSIAMLSMFYFS